MTLDFGTHLVVMGSVESIDSSPSGIDVNFVPNESGPHFLRFSGFTLDDVRQAIDKAHDEGRPIARVLMACAAGQQ